MDGGDGGRATARRLERIPDRTRWVERLDDGRGYGAPHDTKGVRYPGATLSGLGPALAGMAIGAIGGRVAGLTSTTGHRGRGLGSACGSSPAVTRPQRRKA